MILNTVFFNRFVASVQTAELGRLVQALPRGGMGISPSVTLVTSKGTRDLPVHFVEKPTDTLLKS